MSRIDAERRPQGRRRWFVTLLVIAQLTLLSAGGVLAGQRWVAAPLDGDDDYVIAVLGSDTGPPRKGSAVTGRADAIHLVVVSADRSAVSIVSIPRDSYVEVHGVGHRKINAGLTRGPETMVATLEGLTGLEVDDWIVTSFDGFEELIDTVGGVEVDVERRLKDSKGAHSDLRPGVQRLTGEQALAFTRDRKSRPDGDLGRNRAQAQVMAALHRELVSAARSPRELAALAATVRRTTVSSLTPSRLIRLVALAATIPADRVALEQAHGVPGRAGKAAVIRLTDEAQRTFDDVRDDGVLDVLDELPTDDVTVP